MADRTVVLIDGENLALRYESMRKEGAWPSQGIHHIQGVLAWHPNVLSVYKMEIIRVSVYTTAVGDGERITEIRKDIAGIKYQYQCPDSQVGIGSMCPRVFKKENRSRKTKSVDINITIDALRNSYSDSCDNVYLLSGDGDYLPLIEEIMRQGKRVFVGAFSNGRHPGLVHAADEFIDLDEMFFEQDDAPDDVG